MSDFQIQKEPVKDREDVPKTLWGFTWGDLGLMLLAPFLVDALFSTGFLTLSSLALVYLWARKLKKMLPERRLKSLASYYLDWRRADRYNALGRDKDWRPPITK